MEPTRTARLLLREIVQEAERLGASSVWVPELWGADALTPLAWLGASTSRIKLGTGIVQMSAFYLASHPKPVRDVLVHRPALQPPEVSGQPPVLLGDERCLGGGERTADQDDPGESPRELVDLAQQRPAVQYVWILGADQLANFCTWHRWQDIAARVHLAVAQRAEHPEGDVVAGHEDRRDPGVGVQQPGGRDRPGPDVERARDHGL